MSPKTKLLQIYLDVTTKVHINPRTAKQFGEYFIHRMSHSGQTQKYRPCVFNQGISLDEKKKRPYTHKNETSEPRKEPADWFVILGNEPLSVRVLGRCMENGEDL